MLLYLWYLKFVHWIENGVAKRLKKQVLRKPRNFGERSYTYCLRKVYWSFFGFSLAYKYLKITYELPSPSESYHTSSTLVMFILYLDLFFYKSVPELKRYCLGLSTSRINESVGWKYMLQSSSVCTFNSQRVRTFSQQTFVFKTSCKNIFKTSSRRLQKPLQGIFKTSSRRITKLNCSC